MMFKLFLVSSATLFLVLEFVLSFHYGPSISPSVISSFRPSLLSSKKMSDIGCKNHPLQLKKQMSMSTDLSTVGNDIVISPATNIVKIAMKFGGSSLATAERVTYVARFVGDCNSG